MPPSDPIPDLLLAQARGGDVPALGRLLELYRNYLRLVARAMIGQALRVRLDASDLVQETFLKAHREFGQFLGGTEPELVAWLRQILVRTLANQARHHRRQRRDYQRDEPLEVLLERSSEEAQRALAAPLSSPSSLARRREQAVLLADALEKLPPDYRERLLAAHPAIAGQLRACLHVMNLADRMVGASDSGSRAHRPVPCPDSSMMPPAQSVLTTLGPGSGPPPHVQLRDLPDEPEPVIKPRSAEMPAQHGASLGRYQLQGEIARGGMGAILKGRDVDLGRDLALKVLLESHLGNPEVVSRFIEEAQIGGQLQHPGIAPVYELGTFPEPDRRPYFAMKLVKGQTLAALLHERTNPADDTPRFLAIFEAVCQTVAYAHARGVIHRDLKPSNVMVGSFGEVQVMDWGLAKVLPRGGIADEAGAQPVQETAVMTVRSGSAGSGGESQAGSVLGTPAYMAPEQARGEVERIDERADVFGLGAILCEVLTGRPPFAGSTREEIRAQAARGDMADALRRLDASGAETELIGLARSCLAAEPEQRPRNAGEVARRLTAHLAGVQERLRAAELARVEAQARAAEERKRRKLTVALAASVLITAGVAGGGWAYLARQRLARLVATTQVVTDALAEAERLRGQAQSAALGDLTKWSDALGAAKRARDLLAEGEADDSLRGRVTTALVELELGQAAAQERAAEVERDRVLLGQLETIRGSRSEHWDPKQSDAEYAAAFRGFGIDLDQLDPKESGKRIAQRSAPVELASYLDDWALQRRKARVLKDEASWRRLFAAAQAADPDRWRVALRDQIGQDDREVLSRLAADQKTLETQLLPSLALFASALEGRGDKDRAEQVLRRAWRLQPGDFWVNFDLGSISFTDGHYARPGDAARFYSAAVAIRSHSRAAHINLGNALRDQGKIDEAIAEYHEALRLKPDDPIAHNDVGASLCDAKHDYDGAITEFRTALRLKPDYAEVHHNLGVALYKQGKLDEAIAAYREARRIKPDYADAHNDLGKALRDQGKIDEAIVEFREALRIKPDYADAHNELGRALRYQGKLDQAIAEFREVLRLKPDYPEAHVSLGLLFRQKGRFTEALAALKRGHELGSKNPNWRYPSAEWVRQAERMVELDRKLPALLAGQIKPADAAEMLGFAQLCYDKKLHGASTRLWAEAFQAQPKLAEDMEAGNRYNAACAAALAGSGQGKDDPRLDEETKARWRNQAIDWLKADLAAWSKVSEGGPAQARQAISQTLQHWKVDTDLAGIRDQAGLAKLPEIEQKACRALWAEVDMLLAKSQGTKLEQGH